MKYKMIDQFINAIKKLNVKEKSGELAFLCLTGKSENHIRDLISFNIACSKPPWSLQREANRVDLTITDAEGTTLKVEFKMGYASGIIERKQDAPVIVNALKDAEKRKYKIINCIGIMDFKSDNGIVSKLYCNPHLIKRTLDDHKALQKAKKIIKKIWSNSKCRFTIVQCGKWENIKVTILFATIQYTK